jgi:hypothetical protein
MPHGEQVKVLMYRNERVRKGTLDVLLRLKPLWGRTIPKVVGISPCCAIVLEKVEVIFLFE